MALRVNITVPRKCKLTKEGFIIAGKYEDASSIRIFLLREGATDRECVPVDLDSGVWSVHVGQIPPRSGYVIHAIASDGANTVSKAKFGVEFA